MRRRKDRLATVQRRTETPVNVSTRLADHSLLSQTPSSGERPKFYGETRLLPSRSGGIPQATLRRDLKLWFSEDRVGGSREPGGPSRPLPTTSETRLPTHTPSLRTCLPPLGPF